MKKLFVALAALISLTAFGQNGKLEVLTAPTTSTPYILVDTLFTLEDTSSYSNLATTITRKKRNKFITKLN